ncbi:hypothetical protein CTR22_004396 [Salmonella enterica subsp. houtenae]|nr:hypothetical protein [Salmonella enterica subsp. houtenae]
MGTREIALTDAWQQVTTGTESVTLQSKSAVFAICSSQSQPDGNSAYQIYREVMVTPPTVAWVKSFVDKNKLVIIE